MAEGLAKYTPRRKPAATHDAEIFDSVQETLAQAEALRQDFPLREAKLRQATDLLDDATARTDAVLYALDEKKRAAERAAESATHARSQARELLAAIEQRNADLVGASQAAKTARIAAEEIHQEHHRFCAEVDAARLDLTAFLEDVRMGREELQALKAQAVPFAPGAVPGDAPVPGAFASVPSMYPAGPTVLGFLYDLITNSSTGSLQVTGGTMTGALTVDLSASSGPKASLTGTYLPVSGLFGLILDKAKALNVNAHGIGWKVGSAETWSMGQDFDTNNTDNGGTGNSDYILVNDRTANANAGADIFRFSPAEKDSVGNPKSVKMSYNGVATGTPRDNTVLWSVTAGAGLGGINLNINSQNAREHLTLVNAHSTSKRAIIDYNDLWLMGPDIAGVGTDHGFTLRDKENSLNRLFIESSAALIAKAGLNTTGPVGGFHSATSQDATLYDVVQTAFAAGFSTIANRTWLVQQILDASQAENFMWMMGGLGAGSTRATPVATSTNTPAFGIKANQTQMDLIAAPNGTNQTIVKGVSVSQTGGAATVGFFGSTPVVKPVSNEDIRSSLGNLGLITGGVNPLNLNGGQLTAGIGAFAGALQGSGAALQFARLSFTFGSDADATLDATQKQNVILDIQAGVISTTRVIDVVSTATGSFWIIINRNANPVTIKIGANPGITVGATRAAVLVAPGGTTMFRLVADTVYTS